MATITISEQQPPRDDSFSNLAALDSTATGSDSLDLLSDTILDDLTEAIDAFEPLTPLELVLSDWETVKTEPVKPAAPVPTPNTAAQQQDSNPNSASESSTGEPQRAPMKNPSRERLRAELRFLRQRVVEMENELETARQQQQSLQTRKRTAVAWDQVAHSELAKRQRAEEENRQLCAALSKQTKVAKGLERVLRDQLGAEAFARFCDTHKRAMAAADNDAVFARLEDEVDHAYSTVDRVLRECKMDQAEVRHACSQTDVKTLAAADSSGHPHILLELVDSKLVPFDFTRTCDAFWRALSTANVYEHHDVDLLTTAGSTIRFASHLPWNHNGEQRRLRCLVVMKRFVTANRMAVVWRGVTVSTGADASSGVASGWEETGWIVVREMETTRPHDGQDSSDLVEHQQEKPCVLQTVTRHVPHWRAGALPPTPASEREIGAFTTMVLSATEDDITHITGAMQSLLLAEVLDGVSAAAASEP